MADGDMIKRLDKNKMSGQEEEEDDDGSETPGVGESSATAKNKDGGSAGDADVDDDEVNEASGADSMSRKKNKKKKRNKTKEAARSGGESDSQTNPADDGTLDLDGQDKFKGHMNDKKHDAANCVEIIGAESGDVASNNFEAEILQMQKSTFVSNPHKWLTKDVAMSRNANRRMTQSREIEKFAELVSSRTPQVTPPRNMEEAKRKQYQFWDTQPVPRLDEDIVKNEPIEEDKRMDELRHEPYSLPDGFNWDSLNIDDPVVLKEVYTLLNENYVEDDVNMFRFDYSPDFLQWALKPPGWLRDWHIGVRVAKSGKLVGFISGVPARIRVYDITKKMVEINFLCVHKKLRSKRVAPVLIREVTRRVNCQGIFQAVYTAGVVLPKPVSSCRYWHRSLNPRKLIEVKFSHLSHNMTMQRTLKLYKLPEAPKTAGFRPMETKDIDKCYFLVTEYLKKFDLAPAFTREEFCHWFIPRPDIVNSYVVEADKQVTDFVSFYTLPSTVMHHPVHKSLKAAYGFYNVSTKTQWVDLMQDALIVAKQLGFDVFNALDLMENKDFLEKLKFGVGDGNLQYYLYNWKCPTMTPNKVGLVLQ